jgi:hypothetical protein
MHLHKLSGRSLLALDALNGAEEMQALDHRRSKGDVGAGGAVSPIPNTHIKQPPEPLFVFGASHKAVKK